MNLLELKKTQENPYSDSIESTYKAAVKMVVQDGFFDSYTGGRWSAKRLLQSAYAVNADFSTVINRASRMLAELPFFVTDSDGQLVENSNFLKPNLKQDLNDFLLQYAANLLTSGEVFILKDSINELRPNKKTHLGIRIIDSVNVEIDVNTNDEIESYKESFKGENIPHEPENVLHIKFMPDISEYGETTGTELKFRGVSPFASFANIINGSNDLYTAFRVMLKNKGIAGILTNTSDIPILDDEKREIMNSQFQRDTGGATNFNRVPVVNADMKFLQMGMSSDALGIIDMKDDALSKFASAIGLKSTLFNDNSTSTMGNEASNKSDAYLSVIIPMAENLCRKLTEFIGNKNQYLKVNKSEISAIKKYLIEAEIKKADTIQKYIDMLAYSDKLSDNQKEYINAKISQLLN